MSTLVKKLALEQGEPIVPEHLVAHDWERFRKSSQEEIDAVVAVLRSGHLSIAQGSGMPNAEGLEKEFGEYVGAEYCLAVNSGTAALHCAVAGVGIEPGDEVIMPAFTFVATAMAVLHHNAIPIFADIDPHTYLIDPQKIEEKITEKTKAIMPVHIYGLPCDMDEINQIAKKHNLKVIEDCAQAYGPLYKGKRSGALADAAGFAMTTTKHLMVGEGGLLTTNDKEIYEKASKIRLFGELVDLRAKDRAYLSDHVGWNYKIPEVSSALARVKLRHLDDLVGAMQKNGQHLTEQLKEIDGLETPQVPSDRTHAYYVYPVKIVPEKLNLKAEIGKIRNAVLNALTAENVRASLFQSVPVPAQPMFQKKLAYGKDCPWTCHGAENVSYSGQDYPNTIRVLEDHFLLKGLMYPDGLKLMDYYAEAFRKVFENIERVIEVYDQTNEYVPLAEKLK